MCREYLCWRIDHAFRLCAVAALIAAALTYAARADDAVDPLVDNRRLSAIVVSAQYREDLTRYLTGYESWVGPCPDPKISEPVQTLVLQQTIPFPGVSVPLEPQWIEIVRISGCAQSYERPVYATLHEGKYVFFAQLLGSTRAQPILQDRAVKQLVAEEKKLAIASGCPQTQPVRVLTTAYVSESATEYGKAWRETWTVANCHGLKHVSVAFQPDHTGTIAISFGE